MSVGARHDRLFRAAMEDPRVANALLREHLPPAVLGVLRPGPPSLMAGTRVGRTLKETQSDALFQFRVRGGQRLRVYCLVEHKSAPDRWVAVQVLRYLLATWERQLARGARRLTPIVPLVLYHGPSHWTAPRRFSGLLSGPRPLTEYSLDFGYVLVDASRATGEVLAVDPRLRALLEGLQLGARPQASTASLERVLASTWRELDGGPAFLREAFVSYVGGSAFGQLGKERLMRTMNAAVPHRKRETLTRAAREWLDEGLEKGLEKGLERGLEQGLEQGRLEERRAALLRTLVHRFQRVSLHHRRAIKQADGAQLQRWFDLALDASSVAAVFKGR